MNSNGREYLFTLTGTGMTVEGISIPVIDATNNISGSTSFFTYKSPFSFRYSFDATVCGIY